MNRAAIGAIWTREFVERAHGEVVEPGLQSQALGLFFTICAIAEGGGDGFVNHFVWGNGIGLNEPGGFAEINFALDEALEAREIYVDVGAHVLGGNHGGENGGQGLLKGD